MRRVAAFVLVAVLLTDLSAPPPDQPSSALSPAAEFFNPLLVGQPTSGVRNSAQP